MTTDTNHQDTAGLTGAAEAMIAGSAKNLGQLLNAPVEFRLSTIARSDVQVPEVIDDGIHLSVEFDGALTGYSWLVLAADDAKHIVRMTTQDEEVSEDDLLGELGMSALSEAMNQLMAGAATALSDGLGERIDISPPTISENPHSQAERGDVVVVTYEGEIGSAGLKVSWQFHSDLAESLGARWLAAPGGVPSPEQPEQAETSAATDTPPAPSQAAPAGVGSGVISSVELDVAVELGDVAMSIGELLRMGEGSVVTLTQMVGDNVVMLANGTPVASGEVVIVDGTLGFRVAGLITEAQGAQRKSQRQ